MEDQSRVEEILRKREKAAAPIPPVPKVEPEEGGMGFMKKLFVVAIVLPALVTQVQAADFNGDGTDDIAIFRPGTGLWAVRGVSRYYFGSSNDNPIEGDFNGDGTDDTVIFRPNAGLWAVRFITRCYWGRRRDIPIGGSGVIPDPTPPPGTGDVVINEIAWRGTFDSTDRQWIELYNYGSSTVSLDGWTLKNNTSIWQIDISGSYSVSAGGYFVLATAPDPTGGKVNYSYDSAKLMTSGGNNLELVNASGSAVDTVNCACCGWVAGAQGVSMERIDPEVRGCTAGNWNSAPSSSTYGSGSLGTPGAKNSQQVSFSRVATKPLQP